MTSPGRAYSAEQGMRRYAVEGMHPHPLSVTTLLKSIAPAPGLVKWMDKKISRSAAEAYAKFQDVDAAVNVGAESRWESSEDADFGTAVHLLTEQSDRILLGQMQQFGHVPDKKRAMGFVKQWEKSRDAHQMEILGIEVTLVNTELNYAGTADRIVVVPAISQQPLVLDVKTGKRIYADVALQCAALANCDKILYDDGTLEDIPWKLDLEHGIAAHVRPRSAKLYPLDIATAWPIFKPLPQLAMWRAEKIEVVGEPAEPDEDAARRADLRLRVQQLPMDLRAGVRKFIKEDKWLSGGDTKTWTKPQLRAVEDYFIPFEHEARERIQHVLHSWQGGDMELRSKILTVSGRTSALTNLTASEVDALLKTFVEESSED